MKIRLTISAFIGFILLFFSKTLAQPGCPAVNAGPDQNLNCTTPCTNLTATPVAGFQPTSYTVGQIPYAPFSFSGPNNVIINIDDIWSQAVNLPFQFCFFGNMYNQITIGANGLISFNMPYAGAFCPWAITAAIPNNTNAPLNSIMAPWHDIDPSINQPGQTKSVNWGLYGTSPCRIMVISWRNIPMFSGACNQNTSLNATQQIVLYETTNIIETYIQSKRVCPGWNGGRAIHGIQNATGTVAVVVPGRNFPTQWIATNDAWRFSPAGAVNYVVNWFQGATNVGTGTTINVCPPANTTTTYTAQVTYTNCNGTTVVVSDNVNVTTANSFTVTINPFTDVSCNGGNNGSATANPVGGAGGFTYSWNTTPVQNTQTANNLPAGTYTVTVTDANNCQSTQTITISQPTPIVPNPSNTPVSCNGGTNGTASVAPTGGGGGYSYTWNTTPVQNGSTATNLSAGTYTVTITDANNCQTTASITVTQPNPIDLSNTANTPVSCNGGNNGTATVNPSGGAGGYTYSWNSTPVQNTQTATNLPAGTYTVTVTDANSCQATTTVTVTQPTPINLSNTANTPVSCNGGNNGTATVNPTGGTGGYSYSWNSTPVQNTQTATNLPAGTYTVTVTDGNSCQATTTVTVTQPTPIDLSNTSSTPVTCNGGTNGTATVSPTGGAGGYSYSWNTTPVQNTQTATNLGAGTYTVTVTDANNCQATTTVTVTQPSGINLSNNSSTPASCPTSTDGTATVNPSGGAGGYTYAWSTTPVQNTQTATNLAAGNYTVTVTDASNCSATVVINVGLNSTLSASAQMVAQTCPGQNVGAVTASGIGGAGGYTYTWNTIPVQNTQTATNLPVGTYTVTVTDNLTCTAVATATVTAPGAVTLTMSGGNVSCNGNADGFAEVSASGGSNNYSYLWSNGSTLDSIGGLGAGTYTVTVTDTTYTGVTGTIVYSEDFDPAPNSWTLNVSTGVNGADNNFWQMDDDEGGVLPPACGVANNGDNTLHITSVFCPTCGAAYDAGGLCGILFCPETNRRAESPVFSTVGFSNLTLNFDFISMGDGLIDNASVWYNAGLGWTLLNPSIKSLNCFGGQGQWTALGIPLPAACNNNPTVQIGFNWTNNDDGIGTDPSVAVNNIVISAPGTIDTLLCTYVDSFTVNEPTPLVLNMSNTDVSCFGGNDGTAGVGISGGNGNYSVLWSNGSTSTNLTSLIAGTYTVTVTDTSTTAGGGSTTTQTIYSEDFDPTPAGWTLNVPTGPNGVDNNFWQIDDDEGGVLPPGCGVANNGDQTLHITSVFCPTCGAAYDAGGLCGILFCPETNMRSESPPISSIGFNNPLTLSFDFISMGDNLLDNASVWYNAGAGWILLNPSIKTLNCVGGQGQWTTFSAVLPAACNNIANLQIGFNWTNNDDGLGTDPSVAINNIAITTLVQSGGGGNFVLCTATGTVTVNQPAAALQLTTSGSDALCNGTATGSVTVNPTGGTINYSYLWSTGAQTQTVNNLPAGTYTVTVTDDNNCTQTASVTISEPTPLNITVTNVTNVTCNGLTNGSISTNTTGGTPNYTYAWSTVPAQVNPNAVNLPAGTYSVTVTDDNGCTDVATGTVTEPPAILITVTSTQVTCNQTSNGTAFVSASGGSGGFSYLWSNGGNTAYIQNLTPGNYSVTVTDANGCFVIGAVNVPQQMPPIVTAGPDASFCGGTGGVQIYATTIGGTAPYYYTWTCNQPICGLDSVFDNDPIANPNITTTYYVQVIDFNGCASNIDSLVVTVLPTPTVNAGPDLVICGDSAPCELLAPSVFNAPGPYAFQWIPSTGLNNPNIPNPCARPDTTTIYALVVTSSNGCTSVYNTTDTLQTVTVIVPPIPIASAGPDLDLCFGDSIMLQGMGFGAGPLYDFEWSPQLGLSNANIANPMASPALTTDYILTVWSNTCPSYGDTVRVNVHTIPTVDAGPDVEICLGETAVLDAQAWGDPFSNGYTFNWTPTTYVVGSSTVEDLSVSSPSTMTYYVTATSDFNCESPTDSATVYLKPTPVAEAGPPMSICLGDSVQLQGSYSYTTTGPGDPTQVYYNWAPSSTVNPTNVSNPWASPSQTSMYYFTVSYNTCETLDSVLVTVMPQPTVTATIDTTTACEGDSVQLNAGGGIGGTFQWFPATGLSNPNIANPMASPGDTTTYYVILTEGACRDTAGLTLNVIPRPDVALMSSLTEGCVPFDVSFLELADDAIFLTWDFGDGSISNEPNPMHTFSTPGTFTVTLTGVNSGGCKTDAFITVNVYDTAHAEFRSEPSYPVVLTLPNTHVQFTDLSTNPASWLWQFGDGVTSDLQHPEHTYFDEGEYFVTLTVKNENGCISTVTHGPYIVLIPDLLIPNVFSPNDDGINDLFLIKYTGSQPFLMKVFDRWGNLMKETRDKYEGWDGIYNGEPAPDGVYYYAVTIGDRDFSGPVTLMR